MRKFVILMALVVVVFGVAASQGYKNPAPFPDTTSFKLPFSVVNVGVAVDWEGKVWIQAYQNSSADSIDTGGGVYVALRPIYVFNPDGSQASFSPIKILSGVDELGGSVTDTMKGFSGYGAGINRGNGNMLFVWSSGRIWEIDYKTGAGVRFTSNIPGIGANSPAGVATNTDGEIFLARVVGGPGQILNPNFSAGSQYTDLAPAIGRAIEVSPDGNDVFVPRFTASPPMVYRYHSASGSLGPYTADSLLFGWSIETIALNPKTGHLWVAADRRSDSAFHANYGANSFFAIDLANGNAVVDSFQMAADWDPATTLPRGMAFSPTGDTVYVGHFDNASVPAVYRLIYDPNTSVQKLDGAVPEGFALDQNFPNPFNPSTQIRFTIGTPGMTTVRVYDMLGREVAELVNQELEAGAYTATFNASNLTSGTYLYEVVSGGVRLTKKMMLVK